MTLNIKNKLLIALGALLVVTTAVQLWISSGIQSEQAKNDVDAPEFKSEVRHSPI